MALDSLGLGLTLDTRLLDKADKSLENMQRNSQLIMQNLNRGFSAFNRGDASDFASAFDAIKKSMDSIKNSKVSIEFDTLGQDRFIEGLNQIMGQVERIRQIGEVGDNKIKFFDPREVKVTTESLTELQAKATEIEEAFKGVQEKLSLAFEFGKDVSGNDARIAKLKSELEEIGKAAGITTKDFLQMQEEFKRISEVSAAELKDAVDVWKKRFDEISEEAKSKDESIGKEELANIRAQDEELNKLKAIVDDKTEAWKKAQKALEEYSKQLEDLSVLEAKKEAHDNLQRNRDEEKAYQEMLAENRAQQKFAGATTAQQNAMLVSEEQKRLADTSKQIATLTKLYNEATASYEKNQKELAQLLENIATVGRPRTSAQQEEVTRLLNEIGKARSIISELKREAPDVIEKIEAAKKGAEVQKAAADKAESIKESLDYARVFSDNAQSINEEIEAISLLKQARNSLSSANNANYDKEIDEANKRIAKHEDHIKLLTQEQKESKTLEDSVISRYLRERKEVDKLGDELKNLNRTRKERGVDYSPEEKKNIDALVSRWRTLRQDISEIEANNAAHLSQLQEKYASQRAEDEIKIMLATNEREKQEYAKLLDSRYALEKQKKAMEAARGKGTTEYQKIIQQEQELDSRIKQLKAKHLKDLEHIEKAHNKRINDDNVKEFISAQKEKERIADEYAKKQRDKARKYGTISSSSVDRLIGVTDNAKNINQHKAAIQKLEQARASLDNTDKNYYVTLKKIEKALQRHHKELRLAGVESSNLMKTHRGLMDIGGQLARRFALVFSVSQLTQYFRKLVEVRGQFEKTEVALTSIIGDSQKASKLMNQTISLAIKSPFTLQQLTGYTKQLAAYQVSYEELHSTTKMLADVSAGLGVEMDRLILAFGQVKAANYLRATEVRQFTEAGFNILGELAKYYTELEGTMVSVGDVQERVTKRMVEFEDVAEIFERVTSEGGRFYEMQSKQAETLAGQWSNLRDRLDVMLNEIGTSGEGMLKKFVSMLASAVDNWEALSDVIKLAVTSFVLYKVNLLAVTRSQMANNILANRAIDNAIKQAWANKTLAISFKGLSSSMNAVTAASRTFLAANKWLLIISAIIGAITAIIRHTKKMNDALAEQDKVYYDNISSLDKLRESYKKVSKEADSFDKRLEKLKELKGKLEDVNLSLSVKIENVDDKNIDKIFEENEEKLKKAYSFGQQLGRAITEGANAAQGNLFGFSFLGENIKEDAEDYGQSIGKLMSWGMNAQMESIENIARTRYREMGKYAREYFDSIKDGQRANESDYEWSKRRATALVMISKLEGDIVGKNKELQRALRSLTTDTIELRHESKGIFDNLVKEAGGIKNFREQVAKNPIEMSAMIRTEVDKLDYDPSSKEFIINDLYANAWIKVNYVEDPNATPEKTYEGFKKDLMDARDRLSKIVDDKNKSLNYQNFFISTEEIDKMKGFSDGLEGIQKLYDENKKTIEQLQGTKEGYNKDEMARLEALQKELKVVANLWGYDLDLKGKGGESEALKRLKDQIKLIKEANKAYEERNKKFGKAESETVVTEAYKDAFKEVELAIEDIDYTNLDGVVKALETLEEEAKKAGGEVELLKAISEVKAEIGLTLKEKQDRELFDKVQDIFDQYELGVEIKKMGVPKDFAKSFGIEAKTFDQIRDEIIAMFSDGNKEISDILSKGTAMSASDEIKLIELIGKTRVDRARESIEKVNEMEEKAQIERLKTYLKYTRAALGERAKIKAEELAKLKEIEDTFRKAEESAETEEDKKRIREQKALAQKGVQRESDKAMSKFEWEEFRKSETFISLFNDLEGASDDVLRKVITDLDNFKKEWKDLPLDQMKEVVELSNKAKRALDSKDSPWAEADRLKKLISADGRTREQAELDSYNAEQKKLSLEKELEMIGLINEKKAEGISNEELKNVLGENYINLLEGNVNLTEREREIINNLIPEQESIISNAQDRVQNEKDLIEEYKKQEDTLREIQGMANDLYDSFKGLYEALGGDSDSPAAIFADMGMSMANSVLNAIMLSVQLKTIETGALAAGTALNAAMGVIGWIVMGVQIVSSLFSAIANAKDKGIQKQIEAQNKIIERQRELYEELEERVEKAYNIDQLKAYSAELDKTTEKEIEALERSIELEKSKKKTDWEQIEAWEKEIEDARKKLEQTREEMLEMVGGIFDIKDFTSGFVDAWWDAMEEGMDGLDALNEHFEETIKDLIKKQALYKGAQTIMNQVIDAINKDLESDYKIDDWEEIERIAKKANVDLDAFLQGYKDIFDSISNVTGLSELQKGIQGVTEDTAQVIESLLNSMRLVQSESYNELRNQTTVLKEIRTILQNVTSSGSPVALSVSLV